MEPKWLIQVLPVALLQTGVQLLMLAVPVSLLLRNRYVKAWRLPPAVRWLIVQSIVSGVWLVLAFVCSSAVNGLASRVGGF